MPEKVMGKWRMGVGQVGSEVDGDQGEDEKCCLSRRAEPRSTSDEPFIDWTVLTLGKNSRPMTGWSSAWVGPSLPQNACSPATAASNSHALHSDAWETDARRARPIIWRAQMPHRS